MGTEYILEQCKLLLDLNQRDSIWTIEMEIIEVVESTEEIVYGEPTIGW